jgi:MYXO-CTERM domain-containing protein
MRVMSLLAGSVLFLAAPTAQAAVAWTGDFETGDLSQFNFVLNGNIGGTDYAYTVQDVVRNGDWAARLELHDDAIWGNGLRRVELQHLPDPSRTAEGATTCFGWSFYLPEALPDDPGHTLGYWESQNSYQQMMAFNTNGQNIRFITQQPSYTEHWSADGVLTPGQWHRISMCVLWSTDDNTGLVHAWFDGEQVVTAASAKTLADDNPHFAQIGLLRSDVDIGLVPVIYLDDVVEGDTIEDVDPPEVPSGTGTSTGDDGADSTGPDQPPGGDDDPLPGSTSGGDAATSGAPTTTVATSGEVPRGDGNGAGDDDGCSCRTRGPVSPLGMSLWTLVLLGARRQRRDHG